MDTYVYKEEVALIIASVSACLALLTVGCLCWVRKNRFNDVVAFASPFMISLVLLVRPPDAAYPGNLLELLLVSS